MKKYIWFLAVICFSSIVGVATLTGCKKQALDYTTTSDVNIVDYLRRYPELYSEYVKVLDRTNISPFLNAYGAYTCFAPTNSAFKLYLESIGKKSTDELDTAALSNLCRLHLIVDTISTGSFTDGKLPSPTMYGQYLITGVNDRGATVIDRQAIMVQPNILTGNGYIHAIDHVLQPATLTIAKAIEGNSKYAIFTQVLKATGFYDTLNIANNPDTTRRFLTCLAESDSVLRTIGINSYADMVAKYSKTGNPKNPSDSLYLYAAYHVFPALKYVADIVSSPSHLTLAPQSVITVTLSGQSVVLNEVTFRGVLEPGIAINRPSSDNSCTNGVLHDLSGGIVLKVRQPYRVDFDLGDQPEIKKLTSIYRRAGKSQSFTYGQLRDVTWQNTGSTVTYYVEGATTSNHYWWDDGFSFNMRLNVNRWIEFKTPLIVKGRYKIWYSIRRANHGQFIQTTFDGAALPRVVDFVTGISSGLTAPVLEVNGYKRHMVNQTQNNNFSVYGGIVDVATTDRHTIRLTCIKDAGSGAANSCTMDFIQFIPIDDNQLRPLFNRDGTLVP
jgi:uncharacterized surface protein with fasciclin (FAS1) repeats